ncbi:L-fucokinase [Acidobacteriota bacterium]
MKTNSSQINFWDYLVVTASHESQAEAYRQQLMLRRNLGLISDVKKILVIPDPQGRRVGSGGSTLHCLLSIINEEQARTGARYVNESDWKSVFKNLRILIIHAGGDSKRLPPYGPCGKIFVPVPGETDRVLGLTLLDRLLSVYLALPPTPGKGQVIITTGDVLLDFDPTSLAFSHSGITGVGCFADIQLSQNHGVFSSDLKGHVRRFFQKPPPVQLKAENALNQNGQSILDIGIMNLDEMASAALLSLCAPKHKPNGDLCWSGKVADAIETSGLDFFLEICCALGSEATLANYTQTLKARKSRWPIQLQEYLFSRLASISFHVELLKQCGFLHFGTLNQLIKSGNDLMNRDYEMSKSDSRLEINNQITEKGLLEGSMSWIEGCKIDARLTLEGMNVLVGVNVEEDLVLPEALCLDVVEGKNRKGRKVWFVRTFSVDDFLNGSLEDQSSFCNLPVMDWISLMGTTAEKLWTDQNETSRSVWDGKFYPAVESSSDFKKWLWMYQPENASQEQKKAWECADRYSLAEISILADQEAFHRRRQEFRAEWIRGNLRSIFRSESGFTAKELAFLLSFNGYVDCQDWCKDILRDACSHFGAENRVPLMDRFELSRIFHSLGSALEYFYHSNESIGEKPGLLNLSELSHKESQWLKSYNVFTDKKTNIPELSRALREAAFINMGKLIVWSNKEKRDFPKNALRSDEIIWGRAPVRLDLAGGWSDTPPYSLEKGGAVLNAAADLNSQPPIHVYARVISQPVIRISSIDHSTRIEIHSIEELCDYKEPSSQFSLAKAALALSGFSPRTSLWPEEVRSLDSMLNLFGGGLELTTLATIPSGSGLGTSSILGAVLLSVLGRLFGRETSPRELFNLVLQLEQDLTTGGGWQDQIGGVVEGVKIIETKPGLIPDPRIQFLPSDILDPPNNGGLTLLYYTGIRRLAKNILGDVVGRYLNRDREAMDILRQIHHFPTRLAESILAKDLAGFGERLGYAWELKKSIDPHSTTEDIEAILGRIKNHIHGATLLGAGAGGFLLMVCRSERDARWVRKELSENPLNDRSRFFDFSISLEGLKLTVC